MRKQKACYLLRRFHTMNRKFVVAQRDFSFETSFMAQLILDELIASGNKKRFDDAINQSIDALDYDTFHDLIKNNKHYTFDY